MSTPSLPRIARALERHEPRILARPDRRSAATALVLHPDAGGRLRFVAVERVQREGDPWAGQMALPGGRRDARDDSLLTTARREAREEVGIDLPDPIGRLDDVGSRLGGIVVSTWVFAIDEPPELELQRREIAAAVHVPVDHLRSERSTATHRYLGLIPLPAYRYGDRIIWGLTHRTLEGFLSVIAGST